MPPEVWEEYKQLTRRLDFLGWRYSEMWKFRADEISEMFADVIRETDDISK